MGYVTKMQLKGVVSKNTKVCRRYEAKTSYIVEFYK